MSTQPPSGDPSFDSGPDPTAALAQGVIRFLQLLRRKKRVLGVTLAAAFVLQLAYAALAPRYYASAAKLMILEQSPDQVSSLNEQANADAIMASQRELVRSPKVVQAAIDRLRPEERVDLIDVPPDRWVENITSRLSASTIRKTNHMEVGYQSLHPEAAAAVVSAVIDAYLEFVRKSHRTGAADVLDALTGERDRLGEALVSKQWELQKFRQEIGHLALSGDSGAVAPIISRALRLNDALVEAQQRRVEVQASLATLQEAIRRGDQLHRHIGLVGDVVGEQIVLSSLGLSPQDSQLLAEQEGRLLEAEAELRRVSPYLGPQHPSVRALQDEVVAIRQYLAEYHSSAGSRFDSFDNEELRPLLLSMLSQAVTQAQAREGQLVASFEDARRAAVLQSGDLVRLEMLEREVARIEKQHDVLFEKIATVDIHQVQAPIRVTTVQDPLPSTRPASPKQMNLLATAMLGGLCVGALIIYVQDLLDDRFGSPEEMAAQLGLPVLALIRMLKPTGGEGVDSIQMHRGTDATSLEAFRTLRTSLALQGESCDRLVVSSAEPSDGKTTVAANLAVSFAQAGKRTLVIDADLRRPGMTALMNMKGRPGVTDILVTGDDAKETADRLVRATAVSGLDVIPAGPRRSDSAELLAGRAFVDLLAWADSRYDQVLIDCPPVLAVSDAQIVGRLVDGVMLVVSPEKNHRRLVSRACESFRSAGVHVFGVVANRVSESSGMGYGYGYGYSYGEEDDVLSADTEAEPERVEDLRGAA